MIEVKKRENESTASLLRRFSQRVKSSGNMAKVRKLRFNTRPLSELKKKENAIKRVSYRKKMDLLRKLGKIE